MKGIVKFWGRIKGYGFIQGEDGTDYFVHFSNIISDKAGRKNLEKGQTVDFTPMENDKGKYAESVAVEE